MVMPDRQKVIKEFEHLLNAAKDNYQDFVNLTVDGGDEILALLNEQEAVEPYVDGEGNYCCKACDTVVGWEELTDAGLTPYVYKFCPECGKAVKWNE